MENQLPPTQQVRAHVFVSGTVHRVGFRLAAWDKANQWGIGGWVEEIPDGRVEIVFEGSKELVEAVASNDESLMEKYFDKGELDEDEMKEGMKKAMIHHDLFPLFCFL